MVKTKGQNYNLAFVIGRLLSIMLFDKEREWLWSSYSYLFVCLFVNEVR